LRIAAEAVGSEAGGGVELEHAAIAIISAPRIAGFTSLPPFRSRRRDPSKAQHLHPAIVPRRSAILPFTPESIYFFQIECPQDGV
jgi:hypothetical protein